MRESFVQFLSIQFVLSYIITNFQLERAKRLKILFFDFKTNHKIAQKLNKSINWREQMEETQGSRTYQILNEIFNAITHGAGTGSNCRLSSSRD